MRRIVTLLTFVLLIAKVNAQEQEIIATGGGYSEVESGSISWTLGEVVVGIASDGENYITQGFEQAKLIVESVEENDGFSCSVMVYPNPTSDEVRILMSKKIKAYYRLHDLNGEILKANSIENELTAIQFNQYNSGNYFLQIITNENQVKTFKIIKL